MKNKKIIFPLFFLGLGIVGTTFGNDGLLGDAFEKVGTDLFITKEAIKDDTIKERHLQKIAPEKITKGTFPSPTGVPSLSKISSTEYFQTKIQDMLKCIATTIDGYALPLKYHEGTYDAEKKINLLSGPTIVGSYYKNQTFKCLKSVFGTIGSETNDRLTCTTDWWGNGTDNMCYKVDIGYYSLDGSVSRSSCTTSPNDNTSRNYYYTSRGNGSNNCLYTYSPKCGIDLFESSNGVCSDIGIGKYSPNADNNPYDCTTSPNDNTSRNYYYTSKGNGSNNCTYTYSPKCGTDLFESTDGVCSGVGTGKYSPNPHNGRGWCSGLPANAHYTSSGGGDATCNWACNSGYYWNGITCRNIYDEQWSGGYYVIYTNNDIDRDGVYEGCRESGLPNPTSKCAIKVGSLYIPAYTDLRFDTKNGNAASWGNCTSYCPRENNVSYCSAGTWGGKTNWRLPNIDELRGTIYSNRGKVRLSVSGSAYYRSSSTGMVGENKWAKRLDMNNRSNSRNRITVNANHGMCVTN